MTKVCHPLDNTSQLALKVIDHVSAMIAYWDKDLICRFATDSYLEWFGKTDAELIDKITLPELLGPLYEKNLPFLTGVLKGYPQTFEHEKLLDDGTIRHSLVNYFPDTVNGETRGFFVHGANINALKQFQQELVRSYELISAQNAQLINFANIVSHNLRSYSGNLSSLLHFFQQAGDKDEKDEIFKYLLDLSKAFSDTIVHLTENVSIQNLGKQTYEQVSLIETVGNAISSISTEILSSKAQIKISIDPDLRLVTNPAYLESIVLNLLTNALKYSHPDRLPMIEINALTASQETYLTVKDNGLGIDLNRYGDKLFGMNKTFHGNSDARGVGLFITKNQVESLGGRIQAESQVNEGSIFKVALPNYNLRLQPIVDNSFS